MAPVLLVRSFVLDHACWPRSSDATPYLGSYSVLTPAGQFRPWWHSVDLKGQLPRLPHQLANAPAFRNDLTSIKSMLQRVLIIPPSARSGRTTMHAAMLLHVHGWRPAGPAIGRYPAQAARQQPHARAWPECGDHARGGAAALLRAVPGEPGPAEGNGDRGGQLCLSGSGEGNESH